MTISHNGQALSQNRMIVAALGTLGAASAIPIPLAQLDFAGLINVFNIDNGGSPHALLVIAGAGGILTFAVLALAFVGSFLAAIGAPSARAVLIAAALAGLITAMPLWIPAAVVIGAAALLLGHHPQDRHASDGRSSRNLLHTTGVDTSTPRQGAT
jgi:hypothetical protein